MDIFKQYQNISAIERKVILDLIKEIIVYEDRHVDVQETEILWFSTYSSIVHDVIEKNVSTNLDNIINSV